MKGHLSSSPYQTIKAIVHVVPDKIMAICKFCKKDVNFMNIVCL